LQIGPISATHNRSHSERHKSDSWLPAFENPPTSCAQVWHQWNFPHLLLCKPPLPHPLWHRRPPPQALQRFSQPAAAAQECQQHTEEGQALRVTCTAESGGQGACSDSRGPPLSAPFGQSSVSHRRPPPQPRQRFSQPAAAAQECQQHTEEGQALRVTCTAESGGAGGV